MSQPAALLAPLLAYAPLALWLISGIVVFVFAVFSLVVLYHWMRYGLSALSMWIGVAIYGAGSLYLLSFILASLPPL